MRGVEIICLALGGFLFGETPERNLPSPVQECGVGVTPAAPLFRISVSQVSPAAGR